MPSSAKPFTTVYISDHHLTRRDNDSRSEPGVLGPLVGTNARFRKITLSPSLHSESTILDTGDATGRGHIDAWQPFWRLLKDVGLKERTWMVPGNHDVRCCCLGVRVPGKRRSDARKILRKLANGLCIACHHPTVRPWVCKPDARVAVFALGSSNLGNWNVAANTIAAIGYVHLAKFARLLRYSQEPVKIVVLHHSPNIPVVDVEVKRGVNRTSRLARKGHQVPAGQRQALRLLCISAGVRLAVRGHLHRAENRCLDGLRVGGAPATNAPRKTSPHAGKGAVASYTIRGPDSRVHLRWRYVAACSACG